jgi:transcriptional regulator with XRE-family HTH domain
MQGKLRSHNRIKAVLLHTKRYAFKRQSNLARDTGLSESAISRLVRGHSSPSFNTLMKVVTALEAEVGKRLDPRELVSMDGSYPTPNVCDLVGCPGCLPDEAYDDNGALLSEFADTPPGDWSMGPLGTRTGIV